MAPFRRGPRHLRRYREIANILAKHGFGYILDQTGLIQYLPKQSQRRASKERWGAPERILHVLEELGPSFVKLGQIMSIRKDLLPEEYIEQLSKLQDEVPPFPFEQVEEVIEVEFTKTIENLFATFNKKPLASASIGQVHQATLKSGEQVVVKIQRPGIKEKIETDLEILFNIARFVENRTATGKHYRPVDIVEEFAQSVRNELDYMAEGRNAERIASMFVNDDGVIIPGVYWEFTSRRVLVLEFVEGIKISNHTALDNAGVDKRKIAKIVVNAMLKQAFEEGFFHGDPHPGNLTVLSSDQVAFLDFGQVGRIDDWLRERFSDLILALISQSVNGIVRSMLKLGAIERHVNMQALKKDVARIKGKYYGMPMSEIKVGEALNEMLQLSYKYRIRVSPEITLLIKSLMTLEALVQELDPKLSVVDIAEPYGKKILRQRFSPSKLGQGVSEYAWEIGSLLSDLPSRAENVISLLEEGKLRIQLEHENFKNFFNLLNLISNRLSMSIIIASVIVGSSLIAQNTEQSILWRYPVAEVGFLIAVIMGMWLIYTIFRSGRF